MRFRLQRVFRSAHGVFGVLAVDRVGAWYPLAVTLERADDHLEPVIPAGKYKLEPTRFNRGNYPTYEVTPVKGHSRVLLHVGNFERDTEGCVLVASSFEETWVSGSKRAFERFMDVAGGVDSHVLEVRDETTSEEE